MPLRQQPIHINGALVAPDIAEWTLRSLNISWFMDRPDAKGAARVAQRDKARQKADEAWSTLNSTLKRLSGAQAAHKGKRGPPELIHAAITEESALKSFHRAQKRFWALVRAAVNAAEQGKLESDVVKLLIALPFNSPLVISLPPDSVDAVKRLREEWMDRQRRGGYGDYKGKEEQEVDLPAPPGQGQDDLGEDGAGEGEEELPAVDEGEQEVEQEVAVQVEDEEMDKELEEVDTADEEGGGAERNGEEEEHQMQERLDKLCQVFEDLLTQADELEEELDGLEGG